VDTGDRGGIVRPRPVVGKAAVPDAVRRLMDKFDYPDRESPTQVIPILPTLGGGSGTGAFVHLARNATQSIPSAGEAVSWDTLGLQGFSGFTETVPTTTVTVPFAGYYNIAVQFGWSSFTEGGTISILKNGATVWAPDDDPGLWSSTDGQLFEGTAHSIECAPGDTLSVNINPDDASAQTLASATLAAYLVDRAPNETLYRGLVMSHGPIAYWRLGESSGTNAADETGTHNGTYTNTPTLGVTGIMQDGSGDLAADFVAASAEYVLGQDWAVMDFTSGSFSLEAWFNADALTGATQIIIEKRGNAPSDGWEIGATTTGVGFADDGAAVVQFGPLSNDTDYHVVVTSDQTTTILYVNGVQVDSDSGGLTITGNNEVVSIGYDTDAAGFAFDGTIDEVAVYDRVLTAAEIADHYRVGTGG